MLSEFIQNIFFPQLNIDFEKSDFYLQTIKW